ncbi:MFS transporter [Legionella taurinensis]|uniref:MFS transporter n=1 Tax=Legionella taurinensis TaxID=70611 RepID=A0AB38N353_9GAMM|nr:MFS transporter [Legionella taurinensis]MDX1837777.1 MFS transporter [Legionella taurinensis]PUT39717.1 MFS transporter [Legionella taurinensis]PUT43410.1 MFS transporter [Legionella taurinensis]PUT45855.1 MFS transporter [Legionella taurinensis]PUT47768.1 MFS transporter [Legionella taurinensis]
MSKRLEWILLVSQFVMLLAMEMTNPFLPLLVASQSSSLKAAVFYSTLALALPMVANIIMGPLWGRLADRWGYKRMLMRAAWALVFCQGLMLVANSASAILIVRIIQGGFAGFIVAMQTYALSLCDWHRKSRQLARLQSAKAVATTVAGLVGGLCLTYSGYRGLYSTALLLSLLTALVMQKQLPDSGRQHVNFPMKRGASLSAMGLFTSVIGLLILLTQMAKCLTDPVFSVAIADLLNADAVFIGLLYSLPAVSMLLVSDWCGRQFDQCRLHPERIKYYLLSFFLLGALILLAQGLFINRFSLIGLRLLWGVVLAALLPALFTLISDRHPQQGYALGVANSLAKLGNLTGLCLGGYLAGFMTLAQLFLVVAALYAVMALLASTVLLPHRFPLQSAVEVP